MDISSAGIQISMDIHTVHDIHGHRRTWSFEMRIVSDHPKMKVFITHCGLNSMMESAYAGVPMLAIPLQGDQLPSRRRAEKIGIAQGLDKKDVNQETITERLEALLGNRT